MGKNVLIIGASGDIGAAIARRIAREGHHLLLHYHTNRISIDKLGAELTEGQLLQLIQADLSNDEGVDKFLAALVFRVDVVIFAGGKATFGLFQDMSQDNMNVMLNLHVKAPWMITKQLLPSMIKRKSGKIILITSIWGEVGASYEVLYSTVKGAQNSFVKALSKEIASTGVAVSAVSPGFIETKMNASLTSDEVAEINRGISLKRSGVPSEVASAVHYLVHSKGSYLNGQIISVTGGWFV